MTGRHAGESRGGRWRTAGGLVFAAVLVSSLGPGCRSTGGSPELAAGPQPATSDLPAQPDGDESQADQRPRASKFWQKGLDWLAPLRVAPRIPLPATEVLGGDGPDPATASTDEF